MNAKILYVEDDAALSFITKDQLELAGYEVIHCADGKEAVQTFEKGVFDMAILDIMLPNVDGFTIATKIREVNNVSKGANQKPHEPFKTNDQKIGLSTKQNLQKWLKSNHGKGLNDYYAKFRKK